MKLTCILAFCLLTTLSWANPSVPDETTSSDSCAIEADVWTIRLCFNAFGFSACVDIDCDLHWSDVLIPGFGQILGHKGCRPVGTIQAPSGPTLQFSGDSEMVDRIEQALKKPKGSLKFVDILTPSPTFPGPDGFEYRVVTKQYPVLTNEQGRYIPVQIERASK